MDNNSSGGISEYGTADVYINDNLVCNDCSDYYQQHPYGTTYKITDIKATTGHTYNGIYSGNLSGTITGYTATSLKFSTNTYTLTYDNNGGSGCSSKSIKYNSTVGNLCTPTRDGYTFKEWSTDRDDTQSKYKISSDTKVSGDIYVYAIWAAININSYRCDANGDFYYITYCYISNSIRYCNYTEKNGVRENGSIISSDLSNDYYGKKCNASYTSATTNGTWYVFRKPGYIIYSTQCPYSPQVYSFHTKGCSSGTSSEYLVSTTYNSVPILLRTDLRNNIMGKQTVNGKDFYLIFILDENIMKTGNLGCAVSNIGIKNCDNLETINYNGSTYYGVWISAICKQDGVTCPADGKSIVYSAS